MRKTRPFLLSLGLFVGLGLGFGACSGGDPGETMTPDPTNPTPVTPDTPVDPTTIPKGPDFALNHDDIIGDIGDIFKDGRQVSPAEGERLHTCGKVRYDALKAILVSRGVPSMSAGAPAANSAGDLFNRGSLVLGTANFPARVAEADRNTTGGIVRLYDIMIAAAEELLPNATTDNLSTSPACKAAAGPGPKLFDADGSCNADAFACLIGATPTKDQLTRCKLMVDEVTANSDLLTGRRLAVAALAAPYFLCD